MRKQAEFRSAAQSIRPIAPARAPGVNLHVAYCAFVDTHGMNAGRLTVIEDHRMVAVVFQKIVLLVDILAHDQLDAVVTPQINIELLYIKCLTP